VRSWLLVVAAQQIGHGPEEGRQILNHDLKAPDALEGTHLPKACNPNQCPCSVSFSARCASNKLDGML
jgi:hypothetical protein